MARTLTCIRLGGHETRWRNCIPYHGQSTMGPWKCSSCTGHGKSYQRCSRCNGAGSYSGCPLYLWYQDEKCAIC